MTIIKINEQGHWAKTVKSLAPPPIKLDYGLTSVQINSKGVPPQARFRSALHSVCADAICNGLSLYEIHSALTWEQSAVVWAHSEMLKRKREVRP